MSDDFPEFKDERIKMRTEVKDNIEKIRRENCKMYNRKKKPGAEYVVNELVDINRTQSGSGLTLKDKYFASYKVVERKPHRRYGVGPHDGSNQTTTAISGNPSRISIRRAEW